MASTKDATSGIEMGLRYRKAVDDGGQWVIEEVGANNAFELRVRAAELNLQRRDAEACAVFRHVIYEDWQPVTNVVAEPHPTLRGQTVYKVS